VGGAGGREENLFQKVSSLPPEYFNMFSRHLHLRN
jgi:hypothetical protein